MQYFSLFFIFVFSFMSTADATAGKKCDGLLTTKEIKNICGHDFKINVLKKSKRKRSKRSIERSKKECKLRFKSPADPSSIAHVVIVENKDKFINGRNVAPILYNDLVIGMKKRGWFKNNISGLGDEALFATWNVHQKITWRKDNYLISLEVEKGKTAQSGWESVCTKDQIEKLARIVDSRL